jgi:hypothetical protein
MMLKGGSCCTGIYCDGFPVVDRRLIAHEHPAEVTGTCSYAAGIYVCTLIRKYGLPGAFP